MSTSPMEHPAQHDRFALLDGGKEILLPGVAAVSAGLKANNDNLMIPNGGTEQTELNPPTGEVEVKLTIWTAEQWDAYQHILARLRRGDGKGGVAVFTSAHPEVRSRRIKRLYFDSETARAYSPSKGYEVTLKFNESLKSSPAVQATDNGQMQDPATIAAATPGTSTGGTGRGATTATASAVYQAALGHLPPDRPESAGNGKTTATPGYCSAFARVAGTRAGLPRSLFGGDARETENNFRKAGLSQPWAGTQNLKLGDFVFWGNDPSGSGHVGIVVGFARDGMPMIANNSFINKPDGRAINRLDQLSTRTSQPTSYARPGGFAVAAPRVVGPVAPVPTNRPSANVGK